jgi:cobalt-zinc-cadmium efflux system outer membrane protein
VLEGLVAEREQVRRAIVELGTVGEPAAKAAVDAAVSMQRAGKADLLHVLTARRDFALLETRRLDLLRREWSILSDIVALTGELP